MTVEDAIGMVDRLTVEATNLNAEKNAESFLNSRPFCDHWKEIDEYEEIQHALVAMEEKTMTLDDVKASVDAAMVDWARKQLTELHERKVTKISCVFKAGDR